MAKIKGVTVKLYQKQKNGVDPFGQPIFEEVETLVDNVLIAPVKSDDLISQLDLNGKKATYILAIPKGDFNNWENAVVEFFGHKWHTIGVALQGIDFLVPLDWNKKIGVERYE